MSTEGAFCDYRKASVAGAIPCEKIFTRRIA